MFLTLTDKLGKQRPESLQGWLPVSSEHSRSLYSITKTISCFPALLTKQIPKQQSEGKMEMENGAQRRSYVILVPYPFQGHMTPMLQLGHILHSRGFSIVVAHTELNAPRPSDHPEFAFHSLADGMNEKKIELTKKLEDIYALVENCRVPFRDYLVKLVEEKGDQLACIIYDNLMFFVDPVASHLHLPTIVLRPFNAVYLQILLHILENTDTIFPLEESRLQDPIPEFHPLRYRDMPFNFVDPNVREAVRQFFLTTHDIRSSEAIIWNTVEDLEHSWLSRLQERYKVPIFPIGPMHKIASTRKTSLIEEDESCFPWLDKQAPKSVLYVSTAGSIAETNETDFAEIAWGLAGSGRQFLWVVRPGSIQGSEWKERLPEGFEARVGDTGRIVKWGPQKEVLAHGSVGGFWSHCGWNSTLESLGEGVPMICRPHFADQLVNARFLVQEWKVGVGLEELERGAIAETIRRVMVGEESEELRKRAMEMKRKLEASLQKDGHSHRALDKLVHFISSLPVLSINDCTP